MLIQTLEKTQIESSESYQMISEEHLASVVITSQVLAGSRILQSSYSQVVFSDCVFYACEFQGVTFENCIFDNCSFEFSHIRRSEFKNCNFENCTWRATSSTNTIYNDCELGKDLGSLTSIGRNKITHSRKEDASGLSNFNLIATAA